VALAQRMSREVEVRDRQWRLKKYRACFVGREAVRWLTRTANAAPSEDDAVALGNAMLQLGLIAHVVRRIPVPVGPCLPIAIVCKVRCGRASVRLHSAESVPACQHVRHTTILHEAPS